MELRNDLLPQINQIFADYEANEEVKILHVRNEKNQESDVWNDYLIFVDSSNQVWVSQGTTDPGSNAYQRHPEGAAHICLGYHKQVWVIDMHASNKPRFAHLALCSRPGRGCNPIFYFRDADKDRVCSSDDILMADFVGLNCHRASAQKAVWTIGDYSDGCQVRLYIADHIFMMKSLQEFDCVKATLDENGEYSYKFSFILVSIDNFTI